MLPRPPADQYIHESILATVFPQRLFHRPKTLPTQPAFLRRTAAAVRTFGNAMFITSVLGILAATGEQLASAPWAAVRPAVLTGGFSGILLAMSIYPAMAIASSRVKRAGPATPGA